MTAPAREFELCAETLHACEAAQRGGADRVELCCALEVGGVTPSRGFIREALCMCSLPVHVLVRPRAGNFVYTDAEFRAMCVDVEDAIALGAAGIVTGVLTTGGEIDRERMERLMAIAAGLPVTFHRAFDHTPGLPGSLETLMGLGCARVLTSGGMPTVTEGRATLAALVEQASGRIRVAAGGGVTLENASDLLRIRGLDLHASLRREASSIVAGRPREHADSPFVVPADAVRQMSRLVHGEEPST